MSNTKKQRGIILSPFIQFWSFVALFLFVLSLVSLQTVDWWHDVKRESLARSEHEARYVLIA